MSVPTQPSTEGRPPVRVLLASDVRLYRDGLVWGLACSARLQVVAVGDTAARALAELLKCAPAVLLVDMCMADAIQLIHTASVADSLTKIVAFAVPSDEHAILACIEAGAAGYVPRESSLDELVETVECVARGEGRCSPKLTASLFRRVAVLANGPDPLRSQDVLTPRERQIVELIGQGLSNREIAGKLSIEVATTKNHVHNILEKLRLNRRSQVLARVEGRVGETRPVDTSGSYPGSASTLAPK